MLVFASLPLAALAAWAGWRALRGRPVRRFALNAIVGVALLVYFAITAGLGVFWVANQELPVFDLHYLFGYLTALLVIVHVWINAPLVGRFVARAAPALAAHGRFRPSVAWAARLLALAAFGGLCFWIGWSRGRSVVVIETAAPPAGATAAAAGVLPDQLVREGGRSVTLARWYHARSAHARRGIVTGGPRLAWEDRPSPFEAYPSRARIALPPHPPVARATGAALDDAAAPSAAIGDGELALAELAALLHLTQGITDVSGPPGDRLHKRAAASSGALYPVVTHVVAARVAGLEAGLYHYAPRDRALHLVRAGDVRGELAALAAHQADIAAAPVALVLSSIHRRSTWKYGERGYRYVLLDTGHALANAQAAIAGLGRACRAIDRFDDAGLAALLGVDLADQGPMVIVPVGAPTPAPGDGAGAGEPAFAIVEQPLPASALPDAVRIVAGRTGLRLTGGRVPAPAAGPLPPARAPAGAPVVPLPPAAGLDGDPLGPVIERRRSERRFGDGAIPLEALASVLARARGGGVDGQRALRLHVVASRVAGLAPGAYEHRAGERALVRVRAGELAAAVYELALSQQVAERAAAVIVVSADAPAMAWPDGARGLRTAWIDAGVVGGRVYLQATALGLGVSSVGAFFDDEVVALLGLDAADDLPALLVAIGPPPD